MVTQRRPIAAVGQRLMTSRAWGICGPRVQPRGEGTRPGSRAPTAAVRWSHGWRRLMTMPDRTFGRTGNQHALLGAIVEAYSGDSRVLAVGVFGSVGRGTWDEWSDLDLDVIVAHDMAVDAVSEARMLCR